MAPSLKKRFEKALKMTWPELDRHERAACVENLLHPVQPICNFEKACDFKDLSRQYVMPFKQFPRQTEKEFEIIRLENYVVYSEGNSTFTFMAEATPLNKQNYLNYSRKLINSLRRLNPELQAIPLEKNNVDQCVDFILGVTSGYLPEDIAYFMSKTQNMTNAGKTPHIEALRERIKQYFPVTSLGGVLSVETCDKIHAQLDRKFKPN